VHAFRFELGDAGRIEEELGDVLAVISMMIAIGEETRRFSRASLMKRLRGKLVRRHPHVFGKRRAHCAREARRLWEEAKLAETGRVQRSLLDGIAKGTPALLEAYKIGRRVAGAGFDWKTPFGALRKIEEEIGEMRRELRKGNRRRIREEAGDFLFTAAQMARLLEIEPETALLEANRKFSRRFRRMEKTAAEGGKKLGGLSSAQLESLWRKAKKLLR
jgi:tetrapyrrole methylase family protein/MazG family protein